MPFFQRNQKIWEEDLKLKKKNHFRKKKKRNVSFKKTKIHGFIFRKRRFNFEKSHDFYGERKFV